LSGKIQAIRGMHDILPEQAQLWRTVENRIIAIIQSYNYQEIRLPILEKTKLFSRSIGEYTDIVYKEMYTFPDRNKDSLTLRPEGTAGCVRAGLEHGLFHKQIQKLWYIGPMFRHERPQQGRQRQFNQIGIEAFGLDGPDIDAEIIMLTARIWRVLNLDNVRLELNTLGTMNSRQKYREILTDYFSAQKKRLDDDSLRRLETNPLRILDSKNPDMQDLIRAAPFIQDYLDKESAHHFAELCNILGNGGVDYSINNRLVRGLDYYSKTVFEWTTNLLGAQGTICAGGRYDDLVEQFGGKPTPAIGCALGLERLIELIQQAGEPVTAGTLHAYMILVDSKVTGYGFKLAEDLHDTLPALRLMTHCGNGSIKNQFKKADKSGALYALILGPEELANQTVGVKPLRRQADQENIPRTEITAYLKQKLPDI
jgi:histidyl-tRNA synthetase